MKNSRGLWLGTIIIGIALFFWLNFEEKISKREVDWTESYQVERKVPYGLYLLYIQLKGGFKDLILSDGIPDKEVFGDIYLYINKYFQPDSLASERLIGFIKSGGHAMIVSEYIGTQLMDTILKQDQPGLRFYFDIETDSLTYVGDHIPIRYWEDGQIQTKGFTSMVPLKGSLVLDKNQKGNPVFVNFKLGTGQVWIHTVPSVFTNVQLLEEKVFDYAEWVFKFLPRGILLWDIKNKSGGLSGGENSIEEKTIVGNQPLRFILRQKSLATAFYLGGITAILYLLYGLKSSRVTN